MTINYTTDTNQRMKISPTLVIVCFLSVHLYTSSIFVSSIEIRTSIPIFPFEITQVPPTNMTIINGRTGEIRATNVAYTPVMGGSALPYEGEIDFMVNRSFALPHNDDDISACGGPLRTMNEFNQSFVGRYIIVRQSQCSPSVFKNAAASGAEGIIMYGCPTHPPYNCDPRLTDLIVVDVIPIPILSITAADGEWLVAALDAERRTANATHPPPMNSYQMRIMTTGPIVDEERAALISIASVSSMSPFSGGGQGVPLPLWTVARFSNLTLDPCRDRAAGIWCEANHIVIIALPYHIWQFTNNSIPVEFAAFTQLRMLNVQNNKWAGPLPNEWCQLQQLRSISIAVPLVLPSITTLPECVGNWSSLEELRINDGSLVSLPPSFANLTQLRFFHAFRCSLRGELPDLSQMARLEIFDISQVLQDGNTSPAPGFTGPLPTFHPDAPLRQLGLGSNRFNELPAIDWFDPFCDTLEILDINSNLLSGPLPSLSGCTNLQILDLSSQRRLDLDPSLTNNTGFTGSMPSAWTEMGQLNTLFLQENSLVSPVYASALIALQYLDLSHNLLTTAIPSDLSNTALGLFLDSCLSSSALVIRLSYNKLAGPYTNNHVSLSPTLKEIYLDHNMITTIKPKLPSFPPFTFDLSYNNITTPKGFQFGAPAPDYKKLDLRGNPFLRMDPLPSWIVTDPNSVHLQYPGETYSCLPLIATTAPKMDLEMDPYLYDYRFCECEAGTFGKPPMCSHVPSFATLSPLHVIQSGDTTANLTFVEQITAAGGLASDITTNINLTSTNTSSDSSDLAASDFAYSLAFSDDMYGQTNRLTLGMSTSWVVDVTRIYQDDPSTDTSTGATSIRTYEVADDHTCVSVPDDAPLSLPATNTLTAVHTVIIRLFISGALFKDFEDVLSIFEGGSDLKGTRVWTLRGTDPKPTMVSSVYTTTSEYLRLYNASIATVADARLVEIEVFTPLVTVQFNSRHTSGIHFFATYDFEFTCPDGYFYASSFDARGTSSSSITDSLVPYGPLTDVYGKCLPQRVIYEVSPAVRTSVFVIGGVAILGLVILIVYLLWNWQNPSLLAASRSAILGMLLLFVLMALGGLLYAAVPVTDAGPGMSARKSYEVGSTGALICIGRAWLTCLPITVILAMIFVRANRIYSIISAKTLYQINTRLEILGIFLVCTVQVAMLLVFTILPLSRPELTLNSRLALSDQLVRGCSSESGFAAWAACEVVIIVCLMLPVAVFGFRTRNAPTAFNEATHIQNALLLLTLFLVILVPLALYTREDPEASILIQGLGQIFCAITLPLVLFAPLAYYVHRHNHEASQRKLSSKRSAPTEVVSLSDTALASIQGAMGVIAKQQSFYPQAPPQSAASNLPPVDEASATQISLVDERPNGLVSTCHGVGNFNPGLANGYQPHPNPQQISMASTPDPAAGHIQSHGDDEDVFAELARHAEVAAMRSRSPQRSPHRSPSSTARGLILSPMPPNATLNTVAQRDREPRSNGSLNRVGNGHDHATAVTVTDSPSMPLRLHLARYSPRSDAEPEPHPDLVKSQLKSLEDEENHIRLDQNHHQTPVQPQPIT